MRHFVYRQVSEEECAVISYEGNEEVIIIPDSYAGKTVRMLGDSVFAGHPEIKKVRLPAGLTYIGSRAFDGCTALRSLRLPDSLEIMDQYAFTGSGIEIIEIPGNVDAIIPFTFKDCRELNTVVIHKGTKKIHSFAFEDCVNLELAAVPSDTEISHDAFNGCIKLNPNLTRKLISSCQCPVCTGKAPKISYPSNSKVKEFLRKKRQ